MRTIPKMIMVSLSDLAPVARETVGRAAARRELS